MSPARPSDPLRARAPGHGPRAEAGFTLTEVLVALIITVIAVLGLAHTFGIGRGLIDRYATARGAMGVAQRRMEILRMESRKDLGNADLTAGAHGPNAITLDGKVAGIESWQVDLVSDPTFPGGGGQDYRKITVTVAWKQSGLDDHIDVSTVVLAQ